MNHNQEPKKIIDIRKKPREGSVEYMRSLMKEKEKTLEKISDTIVHKPEKKTRIYQATKIINRLIAAIVIFAFLLVSVYIVNLFGEKEAAIAQGRDFYINFNSGIESLSLLDFSDAQGYFTKAHINLNNINRINERFHTFKALAFAGGLLSGDLKGLVHIPELFETIEEVNILSLTLTKNLDEIKRFGVGLLLSGRGEEAIGKLENVKSNLAELHSILPDIQSNISSLKDTFEQVEIINKKIQEYFIIADVGFLKTEAFLDSLIRLLNTQSPRHIVLIFQNPSELRATGGFIGSYAHISFTKEGIENIDVRDIYDPDGQLKTYIVPPKQLRTITTTWGARDSNWFFDFPTSMNKFLEFLELSKIYEEQDISFQGVIALNTRLIEDILKIVGPIEMPEYDMEITSENFLEEVQNEVEAGHDKFELGEPKRILKLLAPRLLDKIVKSTDNMNEILSIFAKRTKNKDIMLYFRNPSLQSYVRELDLSGDLYETPLNYSGDYLAVVNSNIAGGKTDVVIKQKVSLESAINDLGTVHNKLEIERKHEGNDSIYSWYRETNQNYIRVYTPLGSELEKVSDYSKKRVTDRINYKIANYLYDPLVANIDDTSIYNSEYYTDIFNETGKRVFGTWLNVVAGQTRTLGVEYTLKNHVSVADGAEYVFVLEKQSGVDGEHKIKINTPLGYYWLENGEQEYIYESPEVFKREIIKLTMKKDN